MIDVIVVGEDKKIEKTLFSISIQTILDQIHVIVVSEEKHDYSGFQEILSIDEIVTKEKTVGGKRQIGFDKAKGEFVFFMNAGDVFFDVFALFNSHKIIQNYDVVIGGISNAEKKYSNYYLVGNLYRRSFIKRHRICFCHSDGLENGFHQLFFMAHGKINYSGDIIYYQKKEMEKDYSFYHNLIEDTKYAFDIARTRNYDSCEIAKKLYDDLLFFATFFHEKKEDYQNTLIEELKPIMKGFYDHKKSMREKDYKYISDINISNQKVDQIYFNELEKRIIL